MDKNEEWLVVYSWRTEYADFKLVGVGRFNQSHSLGSGGKIYVIGKVV